ncbi:Calx-beta domain-containing protein [Roseibacillus persicicus]|uniref:Calx-beta domain-containing protein n=1 Tax=Roseibacillus persicicus TaxID=454148 RepID=UPI00280ED871|nr:Calx-beta domain-containing protein [Roseibacillus persicicus]MDQ8192506.1 Calx-beta domain-containing protein [Roseibacillus persicicus]
MNTTIKHWLGLAAFASLSNLLHAGTAASVIACETFGDDAGNDIGYSTSPTEFDDSSTDFFTILPNNSTRFAFIGGSTETNVFAAEDIDSPPGGTTSSSLGQVTTNSVDLTGYANTIVQIVLAAPGDSAPGNTSFDNPNEYDHSVTDSEIDRLIIEYAADGINFSEVVRFQPDIGVFNGQLTREDKISNVNVFPAIGSSSFSYATFPVTPGANARIRISMQTSGSGEFFAIDSICFLGEVSASEAPSITGLPAASLDYTEGDGAFPIASTISVGDLDSSSLTEATVAITSGFQAAEDVLAATASGSITQGDITFSGNTLTISATASLADYIAVLQSLTYENTNLSNPNTATRQVTLTIEDDQFNPASAIREIEVTNLINTLTIPFTESFETDGQGTRYFAAGEVGGPTDDDIFGRTEPALASIDGTFAFAVEDVNVDLSTELEAIYFNISASGFTNLKLNLLASAPDGANYDTGDFMEAQVSTDGSTWNTVGAFHATSDGSLPSVGGATISQDLNLDGLGDTDSIVLDSSFQDFEFSLPDAAAFQLRIVMQSNVNNERLLVDNIRVTAEAVEFGIAAASANESDGTLDFTVTRNSDAGSATLEFSTSDGSATTGDSDYTAASASTVTFEDGELTATAQVTITADNKVELDETLTATIANPSVGVISTSAASAVGTINNDDSSTLSIAAGPAVVEGDSGTTNLTFTASLSNPVDVGVTIDLATNATGTATPGTDFTSSSTSPTITAGATSLTFNVPVLGDHEVESNETVVATVALSGASGRDVTLGTATATGTINDDDPLIEVATSNLGFTTGLSTKVLISDLLGNVSGGEGREVTLSSVATSGSGSVQVVGDWVIFIAAPNQTSDTSFTYEVTDGFQTASGTVTLFNSGNGNDTTSNIVSIVTEEGVATITVAGIPNRSYQLETSPDLSTWTALGAPVTCPASGIMTMVDPGPLPSNRMYRIVAPAIN